MHAVLWVGNSKVSVFLSLSFYFCEVAHNLLTKNYIRTPCDSYNFNGAIEMESVQCNKS